MGVEIHKTRKVYDNTVFDASSTWQATSSGDWIDYAHASVNITTTTGRVLVIITANIASYIPEAEGWLRISRDNGTAVSSPVYMLAHEGAETVCPISVVWLDEPGVGTHKYEAQFSADSDNAVQIGLVNIAAKTAGETYVEREVSNVASVPIGGIIAWLKDLAGTPILPSNFVECIGQVIDDEDSVYDGVTIPDLNASSGTARFLRGATTSGGTGGSETHTHPITINKYIDPGGTSYVCDDSPTQAGTTIPSYYSVVWIMRIK